MKISDFIKKYTIYSEDNPEIDQLVTDAAESEIRTCLFCGKPFVARGRNCTRMKYCTRLHYINCQICGNRYYITKSDIQSNKINETCSVECGRILKDHTIKVRYGVDNPSQSEEIQQRKRDNLHEKYTEEEIKVIKQQRVEKAQATMMERYGGNSPLTSPVIRAKIEQTNLERYGNVNVSRNSEIRKKLSQKLQSEEVRNKCIQTNRQNYGTDYPSQREDVKDKMKSTCLEKYGYEWASQSPEIQQKVIETNLARYGVAYSSQNEEIKEKVLKTNLAKYGVKHASMLPSTIEQALKTRTETNLEKYGKSSTFAVPELREKMQETNLKRYGKAHYVQTEEFQQKSKSTCLERYGKPSYSQTKEAKQRYYDTCMQKYGVSNPSMLPESHRKASYARTKIIASDGTKLDSSYELLFYEFCLSLGLTVETQIPIQFEYKGETRTTLIDFRVNGMLFETKGSHLLQGCFDHVVPVPIDKKLEVYRQNHVIIVTDLNDFTEELFKDSNGLKYDDASLIGVDIELFTDDVRFPYRNDRPKCFYDVRVNHRKSAYEAFYDREIRWKMIMNRIQYVGGFIDNHKILYALNVTKTCKQPSWFSKSYAKYLINKYITSDIIVDPFAGWGMRCDASIALNKQYIGIDANPEVVKWHKEHNRPIGIGDARTFKYQGKCSVFICPPYQDVETYFEGQDTDTTQCEWLKIVMQNVPNASEYLMVCKTVDDGWDQYIVEEKINKSHFGINKEYVLKIPAEQYDNIIK